MAADHSSVPFLKYDFIRKKATEFLQRLGCTSHICPIEEIVDVKLGMDVVPVNGLRKHYDTWGLLSRDLSTIYVDEYCYSNYEEKYRFTLAHEVGHSELHAEIYKRILFDSVTDWREAVSELFTDEEYSWLEQQADMYAGLVLVPGSFLKKAFDTHAKAVCDKLFKADLKDVALEEVFSAALQEISRSVASSFLVSPKTVESRLYYDDLQKMLRGMLGI